MDIYGGIENDVNTEMAEGVENADVFICFCTQDYQKSRNCKKELEYADKWKKHIIPVICDPNYTQPPTGKDVSDAAKWPCEWLGFIISGLLYDRLAI